MKVTVAVVVILSLWQQATGSYCPSGYFNCGDGFCVPNDNVCDGTINCNNGADEDDCPTVTVNIGLAAGLAVAGFVLFIVLPIIIIPIICCCCVGACASAATPRRTRIVTQAHAAAGPQVTVVSANSSNMMQSPVAGMGSYPPPHYTPNPSTYQPAPAYKV